MPPPPPLAPPTLEERHAFAGARAAGGVASPALCWRGTACGVAAAWVGCSCCCCCCCSLCDACAAHTADPGAAGAGALRAAVPLALSTAAALGGGCALEPPTRALRLTGATAGRCHTDGGGATVGAGDADCAPPGGKERPEAPLPDPERPARAEEGAAVAGLAAGSEAAPPEGMEAAPTLATAARRAEAAGLATAEDATLLETGRDAGRLRAAPPEEAPVLDNSPAGAAVEAGGGAAARPTGTAACVVASGAVNAAGAPPADDVADLVPEGAAAAPLAGG